MTRDHLPRYATIDIGTNSIKFHIGERLSDGTWRKVIDRAEVVRLGEGLRETGIFNDQAMARATIAIANMVEEAKRNGVVTLAAVATMGMRNARNAEQFMAAIQSRCGVYIEVISGEEEARLAYLAVQTGLGLPDVPLVVFDSGGGSTQFTFGHGSTVDDRFSLNVGAARFTERYALNDTVSETTLSEALGAISADLTILDTAPVPEALIGMGGAVTNMVAVKLGLVSYAPDLVQGAILTRSDVEHQIEQYRSRTAAERQAIIGLQPGRAGVILAGACIVKTVMEKFRKEALKVSDRSLRHGLLIDRFSA
jgi:exopolyphosphatase / guanosine-5'-triphosphate,3'-diphosphate pyrophosphatase